MGQHPRFHRTVDSTPFRSGEGITLHQHERIRQRDIAGWAEALSRHRRPTPLLPSLCGVLFLQGWLCKDRHAVLVKNALCVHCREGRGIFLCRGIPNASETDRTTVKEEGQHQLSPVVTTRILILSRILHPLVKRRRGGGGKTFHSGFHGGRSTGHRLRCRLHSPQ